MRIETVPIDMIKPNEWNPNEMDDETFNRLAEELDEQDGVGYIDPIQVVPMDDGTYQIIGGEHRWRAMRVLGHEELQVVVLDDAKWSDTDLKKFVTMRLNVLHGETNPQKFMDLYMDLSDRYDDEAMQALMSFTDDDAWKMVTKDVRKSLEDALDGLDDDDKKKALEKFDESKDEIKTVEGLSTILNQIFTSHGETLYQHFIVFSYGGKKHVYVELDNTRWKTVNKMIKAMKKSKVDSSVFFSGVFDGWVKRTQLDVDA